MTISRWLRIYGALVSMLTTVTPLAVMVALLVQDSKKADGVKESMGAIVVFILLPALSGVVSGAMMGGRIADRDIEKGSALLKGAAMALLTTAVYCSCIVAIAFVWGTVAWPPLGGVMVQFYVLCYFVLVGAWTMIVGFPMGVLAGLILYTIGGYLSSAETIQAAVRQSRR
jgi:hypothetical protein